MSVDHEILFCIPTETKNAHVIVYVCVSTRFGVFLIVPSFQSKKSTVSQGSIPVRNPVTLNGASPVPGTRSKVQAGVSKIQASEHPSPFVVLLSSHSSHSLEITIPSPHTALQCHTVPSPVNPEIQEQEKLHIVLVHTALVSQLSVADAHSSISSQAFHAIGHVYPDSMEVQLASQPSHDTALASSHTSPSFDCITPSPQYSSVAEQFASVHPLELAHLHAHPLHAVKSGTSAIHASHNVHEALSSPQAP